MSECVILSSEPSWLSEMRSSDSEMGFAAEKGAVIMHLQGCTHVFVPEKCCCVELTACILHPLPGPKSGICVKGLKQSAPNILEFS